MQFDAGEIDLNDAICPILISSAVVTDICTSLIVK